jgi:hypothetical protein
LNKFKKAGFMKKILKKNVPSLYRLSYPDESLDNELDITYQSFLIDVINLPSTY